MNDVIQPGPHSAHERISTLITLRMLEEEQQRIQGELRRITVQLSDQLTRCNLKPVELQAIITDLQTLANRLQEEIQAQARSPRE